MGDTVYIVMNTTHAGGFPDCPGCINCIAICVIATLHFFFC